MEYYTAERKMEVLPFATAWMDLEIIVLSEISQAVKDKYHMILTAPLKKLCVFIKILLIRKMCSIQFTNIDKVYNTFYHKFLANN